MSSPEEFLKIAFEDHRIVEALKKRIEELDGIHHPGLGATIREELQKIMEKI